MHATTIRVTRSATEQGVLHKTVRNADGQVTCTCKGFYYRGHCKHTDSFRAKPR